MPARFTPILLALLLAGCPPDPGPTDGGALACTVEAPTSCERPELRYSDVKPIIDQTCVGCHDATFGDGPWPLASYTDVADWADTVRDDIANCSMPPPDGGMSITDEQRRLVLDWLRCGFMQ